MHYVTRERVHVDRIFTAWAIRRFVDPEATFSFVARTTDAHGLDAIPFDMRGATIGHRRGRCTFEVLLDIYTLDDSALRRLARIVHAADFPQQEHAPAVTPGVLAIFDGLRDADLSDSERLVRGFGVCEALYAYCQQTGDRALDE